MARQLIIDDSKNTPPGGWQGPPAPKRLLTPEEIDAALAKLFPVMEEGGEGSGWFALPKGTHKKGSQGGPVDVTQEDVSPFGATVQEGDIIEERRMTAGITRSLQVEYRNGEDALFKRHYEGQDAFCEKAAGDLASLLLPGEKVVPEVVIGEHEGKLGSFQEWLDGDVAHSLSRGDLEELFARPDTQDRLEVIMALDIIMHSGDRHNGNWIVGDDGKIYGIDHGFARWSKRDRQIPYQGLSPAWEGFKYHPPIDVPGVTTERGAVFRIREETLDRWRDIGMFEFADAIEPSIIEAEDRLGSQYSTRVNIESGWENFQLLLDYNGMVKG